MFTCKICHRSGLTTPADLPGGPICHRCADRLAFASPRLLAACEAAEYFIGRLWMPNKPTVAEAAQLKGRLQAAIAAAGGAAEAAETVEESWPDTSVGSSLPLDWFGEQTTC